MWIADKLFRPPRRLRKGRIENRALVVPRLHVLYTTAEFYTHLCTNKSEGRILQSKFRKQALGSVSRTNYHIAERIQACGRVPNVWRRGSHRGSTEFLNIFFFFDYFSNALKYIGFVTHTDFIRPICTLRHTFSVPHERAVSLAVRITIIRPFCGQAASHTTLGVVSERRVVSEIIGPYNCKYKTYLIQW